MFVVSVCSFNPAFAADKNSKAEKTEKSAAVDKSKVFKNWMVECETTPAKTELCFASQNQTVKDGKGRLIKVSIGYIGPKGEPTMVAMLPLGIYIPAGAAFKVGEAKTQTDLIIQSCTISGCSSIARIDDKTLESLKTEKEMTVGVKSSGESKIIAMKVPLEGFKEALDSIKKK